MFEGYRTCEFMEALQRWDSLDKKAKCVYREKVYSYDIITTWGEHFQPLNGALILEGQWYTEV
ncbi:hypothetical protein [Paenibacillus sp. JJ1722]|uniref:hypothetical protein n=1 Tax=Paenibacillus sp. JJ1722 TaxID=3398770 RepID=UPI003AAE446A